MIENINNAQFIIARSIDICEFCINKQDHTIIQTKTLVKCVEKDITDECINLGCKYIIDKHGNVIVDYKVGNILVKILNSAFDMDCIKFFADYNFDIEYA